jgi:hypothetical protein
MADKSASKTAPKAPNSREERLKAALKANMGRRKAQARARKDVPADQQQVKDEG